MGLPAMFDPTAGAADLVTDLLHDVIDPEVGLNIVDLGLLRDVKVDPDCGQVSILMTLTTPSCPLGPYIEDDINQVLGQVPWVTGVDVHLVWEPAWDPARDMSERAKREMGWPV